MGLISAFKDSFFISKCIEQVRHVQPDSSHLASEFCDTTRPFLLAMRDKGANQAVAVNMVCLMILDKADDFCVNEDARNTRARALVIASNYCASFAERWPDDTLSSVMLKAARAFAEYMRTHRVTPA
jgi:hypothetical protein